MTFIKLLSDPIKHMCSENNAFCVVLHFKVNGTMYCVYHFLYIDIIISIFRSRSVVTFTPNKKNHS